MAVVIVATPGAANANSYCTLAEADAYHEGHSYSGTWTDGTTDQKNRALVTATALLDEWYEWADWPESETQALQWPRGSVMDILYMSVLSGGVIPQKLKDATAELARQVLAGDRMKDSDVETQGITSMSAGPVSFSFKDSVRAKVIPDRIRSMIPSWWGRLRGHGSWVPIVRS